MHPARRPDPRALRPLPRRLEPAQRQRSRPGSPTTGHHRLRRHPPPGRLSIAADLRQIFGSHQTPAYVGIVRRSPDSPGWPCSSPTPGMIPPGGNDFDPALPCTPWSPSTRAAPLADLAVPGRARRLAPAPRGPRGASAGTARAADDAVTVLVTAADLLADGGRVVLLDVRWALGDDQGGGGIWVSARRGVRRPRDGARGSAVARSGAAPAAVVTATAVSGSTVGDPERRRRRCLRRDRRAWPRRGPGGCFAGAGCPRSGCWTAGSTPGCAPGADSESGTSSPNPVT